MVDIQQLIKAAKKSNEEEAHQFEEQAPKTDENEDQALEKLIEKQAKEIELKQQQEAEKSGKKISKAAKALNNAEMGMDAVKGEAKSDTPIIGISNEQFYIDYAGQDQQSLEKIQHQDEAAAISMAKKAVQEFMTNHPETKYPEIKQIKNDKSNLELDLGDNTDFRS